ncbi:hypothetical protein LOK49_LG08G03096 [Camellia lanceoleosa]|uniref:Uncharacterized protein n=1 Tax=Camellia lanceoleosa TaxID=1840588 RepID=A0ACC0GSV6_9ERIC|nr:hypothetical protein LOK49_LG08G03096 [Camellia lanceoleosa]
MATTSARVTFRIVLAVLLIVAFFYLCRPLYWKISATVQDIRISQIVLEAQKSVGWYRYESDSGLHEYDRKALAVNPRRILRQVLDNDLEGQPS